MTQPRLFPISRLALALAVAATLAAGGAARAAEPEVLDVYRDWTAFSYTEGGNKVCYIASEPTKKEGKYTERGDVLALVTHMPAENSFGVVSIVAGYTYKEGSEVLVNIGGDKFKMFTHQDRAWARDAEGDKALIQAMKRGTRMVVAGTSSKDTRTTDTYSLLGFTKAFNRIGTACKAKGG